MGHSLSSCARDHPRHARYSVVGRNLEVGRVPTPPLTEDGQSSDSYSQLYSPIHLNTSGTAHRAESEPGAAGGGATGVDVELAVDQIFLLCETGVAATIKFIIDSHPEVEKHVNERRACSILDTAMQLTPLQLSAACGHADVVGVLLLSPSVQVNIADPLFSMTALHLAVHLGQLFAVETLCRDSRVEVDLRNLDGKTPIHLAAQARNVGMVETLLRLRPAVDLRVKDFDGNNALHTAAQNPSEAIMRALVQHVSMINFYCDPFDPSDFGKSTKSHSKRTIFETSNCNGESAIQILSEALREERRLRAQQLTAARETTADSAVPPHTTRSTTMGTQSDAAVAMSLTEQPQPAGLRLSVGRNLDVDHMEVEGDQDAPAQHTTTESPTTASPSTSDILRKRRGSFSLPTAPVIPVPAVQEGVVEVAEAQDSSASAAEECERGARDGEAGNAEIGNKLRVDADIAERTAGDEAGERGTCDALRELECCLHLLSHATHASPDSSQSLSSFGDHSPSSARSVQGNNKSSSKIRIHRQNTRGREHVEEKAAFSWSPANEALLLTLSSSSDSAENGLESGAYYTPDSIHSDY